MNVFIRESRDEDGEFVRSVRNSCRAWMTRDGDYITPEQQSLWWEGRISNGYRVWVIEIDDEPAGFCMYYAPENTGTLGLLPEHRGKGVGTIAYRVLASMEPGLKIEILNSNKASMKAALKAGFRSIAVQDKYTQLIHP